MKRVALYLTVVLAVASCAGPAVNLTPQQRTQAMRRYVEGATLEQVATELTIGPTAARAVIRTELRRLNRRYHGER